MNANRRADAAGRLADDVLPHSPTVGRIFLRAPITRSRTSCNCSPPVTETWRTRRGEVEEASDRIAGECGRWLRVPRKRPYPQPAVGPPVRPALCDHAVPRSFRTRTRTRRFGGAPKVSAVGSVEALLRSTNAPRHLAFGGGGADCTAMARGGIYDQLAGGVRPLQRRDASWVVPHFERCSTTMLCCFGRSALGPSHVKPWPARWPTRRRGYDRRAGRRPHVHASLDADADGTEADLCLDTDELREVLVTDDGRWGRRAFQRHDAEPSNTAVRCAAPNRSRRCGPLRSCPHALLAARLTRPQPAGDDKVVTAWNGLAITASPSKRRTRSPEFLDAAIQCARLDRRPACRGRPVAACQPWRTVGDSAAILEANATLATGC